ncbi:FHA domain-containing protein [Agromyces sp. ISL-38]|uniref:FHA domain-containing protein n=1 Tax=Agromyces sp. ISL-38 TaxID=2819107 RepID=UPI001BE56DA4|nr:FHA domain-containing protein [Agromyces sp. ISL-38]MBT2499663.1 FHA domain-containing protein [Agromyces sp. ISL-38]
MAAPDFIVPPPGLIPNAPENTEPERTVQVVPGRALPSFVPTAPHSMPSPMPPVLPMPGPAPTPSASNAAPGPWRLTGERGFEVVVEGRLVLGRDPVAAPPHSDAKGVPIVDPARSVSKTHALVEATADGVSVTDLHSTNGVRIRTADVEPHEIAPGMPAVVPPGASFLLGDLELHVDRLSRDTV